jgi:hypothetical protein
MLSNAAAAAAAAKQQQQRLKAFAIRIVCTNDAAAAAVPCSSRLGHPQLHDSFGP